CVSQDYINGIISVPESPQLNAFAPTSISGPKAADPTSTMQFMSPPYANQKRDSNTSYPINIPAGINGFKPSFSFGYNSGGGNGWMGEGWDLNGVSSITIDTRWGTPEFDITTETELYSLDGEMLIYPNEYLPHRHSGEGEQVTTQRQSRVSYTQGNTKRLFLRRNHGFSIIERIGTLPSNYYWKITDTDGTKRYFGGNSNSTLSDNEGNIVHWGLRKIENSHGNIIEFTYHNMVVAGNSNLADGRWFQIKSVTYGKNQNYNL